MKTTVIALTAWSEYPCRASCRSLGDPSMMIDRDAFVDIACQSARVGDWSVDNGPERRLSLSEPVRDLLRCHDSCPADVEALLDYVEPTSRDLVRVRIASALDAAVPFRIEVEMRDRTGRFHWVRLTGKPIQEPSGEVARAHGLLEDITDLKRAQRREHRLAGRLESTIENMTDAFFMLDGHWRFRYLNPEGERLLQRQRGAIIGEVLWDAFPGAAGTVFETEYRAAISTGQTRTFEALFAPLHTWFEVRAYPSEDGLAVYFRDITERKQAREELEIANQQLRVAKEEAERANRAKSEFLSAMSHELRTPLNAVLGLTQMLNASPEPESDLRRQYYEEILRAGWYLRDLMNDVLDFAKIETGRLAVELEDVSIPAVVDASLRLVEGEARNHRVSVEHRPAAREAIHAYADPLRLRQILLNLLSNAAKYNRPGGQIEVSYGAGAEQVWIDVVDTGAGIDPSVTGERLFEPFDRLGRESGAVEGSGIGLPLVRRLGRLMGGDVELVESEVGEGSRFRVRLPRSLAGGPAATAGQGAAAGATGRPGSGDDGGGQPEVRSRLRLLYIEDQELNRMVLRGLVQQRRDAELIEAEDGYSGLEAARVQRPDIILLDLHLPDIHGSEVLRYLREDPGLASVPVIAVSADALHERDQDETARFDAYVVKPFDFDDLNRILEDWETRINGGGVVTR